MHESSKFESHAAIGSRKVTVEVGVGHAPGRTVLDRLENTDDIANGSLLHVSLDENRENLRHVALGAVAHMSLQDFAKNDFLDNSAERIYIFNVFGESGSSAAKGAIDDTLFLGLKKKLTDKGMIIIGEHITPDIASPLKDAMHLKQLGFNVECYDLSSIAIDAKLTQLGFSKRYAAAFTGQREFNKAHKGSEHAGFLLMLSKNPDAASSADPLGR